jgi:hypothetical protein
MKKLRGSLAAIKEHKRHGRRNNTSRRERMIIENFSILTDTGRTVFTLDKNPDGFGYTSASGEDAGIRESSREEAAKAAAASYAAKAWDFLVEE